MITPTSFKDKLAFLLILNLKLFLLSVYLVLAYLEQAHEAQKNTSLKFLDLLSVPYFYYF